jgi:hypothetical protein
MKVKYICHCCGQDAERECCDIDKDMVRVDNHEKNSRMGAQGVQVFRCKHCDQLWILDFEIDPSAGSSKGWSRLISKKEE